MKFYLCNTSCNVAEEILKYNSKGVSVVETLCVYILKNCHFQFLSHVVSAELVFCSEELIFLPYKNQNKSLTLSSRQENSNFSVC